MTDPIAAHLYVVHMTTKTSRQPLTAVMFDQRAARLVYAGPTGTVR